MSSFLSSTLVMLGRAHMCLAIAMVQLYKQRLAAVLKPACFLSLRLRFMLLANHYNYSRCL